ncbi:MAG: hypothetical protein KGL19_04335 [Bacteroidota bacterium]|nr:hypothetical protein [Bacteroidota bacterium]
MKKIITIIFVTNLLLSCNSGNDKEKNTATDSVTEKHNEPENKTTGLVLNDGIKWKADSTTLINVANLQTIVSNAKNQKPENYLQTASALQDGLSKMISECKMKGADYEALHQWLEPLMEKTKELKDATVVENAATTLNEIENQINLFTQYFEK